MDCHICFACIVIVMKVHSLVLIFESKAMESLYAVGSTSSFRSNILMWLLGHILEEEQEDICLFCTLEWLIGTVRLAISFLIISYYVQLYCLFLAVYLSVILAPLG